MTLQSIHNALLAIGPEVETLNRLNEKGLISDHCVKITDIAEVDAIKALDWLKPVPF